MLKITLTIFFSLVSKSFTLSLTPLPPPPPSSSIANCFSAIYCCNLRSTHEIQYHWEAVSHYCEHTNILLTAVEIDESGSLLVLSRRLFDVILFIFQKVRMSVKKTLLFNPLAPKSDWFLISPYNITLESNVRVMREEELIIILRSGWLLIWKRPWPGNESQT